MSKYPTIDCQNHSTTVETSKNHSTTVDRNFCPNIISTEEASSTLTSCGKFQTYPEGIFNPAFCGMMLWELVNGHILNDYEICCYHQIWCGIIKYGCKAYIFTPITNNDINSHLKILLRQKKLKDNIPTSRASRKLVIYCREQSYCRRAYIPCTK